MCSFDILKGFDELLALAENGEHRNVDMLVGWPFTSQKPFVGINYDLLYFPVR